MGEGGRGGSVAALVLRSAFEAATRAEEARLLAAGDWAESLE